MLLASTDTATTKGFQQMFDNTSSWGSFYGLLFVASIALGLIGCITRQVKRIKVEKGFLKFSTALILHLWASCAALRRVVSLVVFFVPAMGLMSILNHWKAEQIPFGAAQSVNPTYRVELFNGRCYVSDNPLSDKPLSDKDTSLKPATIKDLSVKLLTLKSWNSKKTHPSIF